MQITRHPNGRIEIEGNFATTPEDQQRMRLYREVCASHNQGRPYVENRELWEAMRDGHGGPELYDFIAKELEALARQGVLRPGEDGVFHHTSTLAFRLEQASALYREIVEDIHLDLHGAADDPLRKLLDHADDVMRWVKSAGDDRARAAEALEVLSRELGKRIR
ncbi:hypothetical protein [Nocardiopsis halophila]|uniref:hypothetical protein n=1 Tax=Nocardiopsis halophila TaxID=141692 RepID=UPI0003774F25|nr:hypothetical protein [Nocardiopsis halophila]